MRIMLVGQSCSGKDTIAELLCEVTGEVWTNLSFAHDLEDVCNIYQVSPCLAKMKLDVLSPFINTEESEFNRFKIYVDKNDKHNTKLKVALGTWARMQDKDIWVRYVLRYISNNPKENMIVTDTRLENEFVSLLQRGFIPISVEADEVVREGRRFERDGVNDLPKGKSEEEIEFLSSQCEYTIINNTSQACLKKQLATIVNQILKQGGATHKLV